MKLLSANAFNMYKAKKLSFIEGLTLSQISPGFYVSAVQIFWNTVGKGEIVC